MNPHPQTAKRRGRPKLDATKANQRRMARYRRILIVRATPAELRIKKLFEGLREKAIFQKGFFAYRNFIIVDFYLPKRRKLCLEIDGPYHQKQEQVEADKLRDTYLRDKRGFRVKRMSNDIALTISPKELLEVIAP